MKNVVLAMTALFFSITALAADRIQYGFAPSLSFMSLSDPEGSTSTEMAFNAISGIVKFDAPWRNSRWIAEIGFQKHSHSASVTNVGQESHTWNFGAGFEMRYPVTRKFDFYPGILIGAAQSEHASRHVVDTDGFLAQRYDARNATEPFIRLQAGYYRHLNRKWDWGVVPSYQRSLGDGYSGLIVGVNFLY